VDHAILQKEAVAARLELGASMTTLAAKKSLTAQAIRHGATLHIVLVNVKGKSLTLQILRNLMNFINCRRNYFINPQTYVLMSLPTLTLNRWSMIG
jgi:hypothetical protein